MNLRAIALATLCATSLLTACTPATDSRLPDFAAIEDVNAKKQAFFDYLTPIIQEENQRILAQREQLLAAIEALPLSGRQERAMRELAVEYLLLEAGDTDTPLTAELLGKLQNRVDMIPPSLALSQAAIESGWGTSRFAREGLNLFGHWCYTPGCGLVPEQRAEGDTHEVRKFDSVNESVRAYLHNLNTQLSYGQLRNIRRMQRATGQPVSGQRLARGLSRYSERGEVYVEEVKGMISANDLAPLDAAPAGPPEA